MILGVDYGDSRTGYAISDSLGFSANTLETYPSKEMSDVLKHTAMLVNEHNIKKVILGFPKNMNGTIGERGKKTKTFAKMLAKLIDAPIILWDERLTTVSAHNLMNETNIRGKKRKESVDKIAAAFILQAYLDSNKL